MNHHEKSTLTWRNICGIFFFASILSSPLILTIIVVVAAQRFFFVNISIFYFSCKRGIWWRDDESRSLILAPTNWFWQWSSVGNIISWMSRYILSTSSNKNNKNPGERSPHVCTLIEMVISIFHCSVAILNCFFGDEMTINAWRQTRGKEKNCWQKRTLERLKWALKDFYKVLSHHHSIPTFITLRC